MLEILRKSCFVLLISGVALTIGCSSSTGDQSPVQGVPSAAVSLNSSPLDYTIIKDESEDNAIHSLVRLHILATGHLTKESLTDLLKQIYEEKRKGPFTYHPDEPDFSIFVYPDQDRTESESGSWIAMLDSNQGSEPKITVDEKLLEYLADGPKSRFGISQNQRERFYWNIVACQDKLPDDAGGDAQEGCKYKERRKYRLSQDQVDKIVVEGSVYKWPIPKPHQ